MSGSVRPNCMICGQHQNMAIFTSWYMQVSGLWSFRQQLGNKPNMKAQKNLWLKSYLYIHALGEGERENWMDSLALRSHNRKYEERIWGISYAHFWLMFEDLPQMGVHFSSHKGWRLLSTVKWKTELLDSPFMQLCCLHFIL